MLNMIDYASIYLKNRVLNMWEFWMCLMQYMHEVIVQITEQLLRHKGGGVVKLEHFDKHFIKNTKEAT